MACKSFTGKILGDYTLHEKIGEGTFGKVYLATETSQGSSSLYRRQPSIYQYAIKIVDTKKSNRKEKEMLHREIELMQKLDHKNIVKYVNFFLNGNNYTCIVMEYCEQGTLYQYIRDHHGVKQETKFMDVLQQITSGLEYLHNNNVLHRDVKSKNILINGSNVKIGDFGVARELAETGADKLTVCVGSPQYMSPEMLSKAPQYDKKTDIWSLGCTCYEMGIGDYAFKGENMQKIRQLVEEKMLPAMDGTDYCHETKTLIMRMLQNEPSHRPTTRQILEEIKTHRCQTYKDNTLTGSLKSIATVSPRMKPVQRIYIPEEKADSGLISNRSNRSNRSTDTTLLSTWNSDFSSASTITVDKSKQVDHFQNLSCKYQAQLVRLIGDNEASSKVSKIMKVLRKHQADYEKIQSTVKRYVKASRYDTAYGIVLALKGAQEALVQLSKPGDMDSSGSSGT